MSEVTLVFENPRREDGTRLLNLDVDEVAVGRRLFRDGTSEYQVNNQGSRLKDIKELFLDSNLTMRPAKRVDLTAGVNLLVGRADADAKPDRGGLHLEQHRARPPRPRSTRTRRLRPAGWTRNSPGRRLVWTSPAEHQLSECRPFPGLAA